jgi:hypothetical protein
VFGTKPLPGPGTAFAEKLLVARIRAHSVKVPYEPLLSSGRAWINGRSVNYFSRDGRVGRRPGLSDATFYLWMAPP